MELDIVDDQGNECHEDRSKPEVKVDDDLQHSCEQELMNLRALELLNELMSPNPKETSVTVQDVDCESMKYIKNDKHDPS